MNAEHLLEHYRRIADASDAIARMQRFILDLAVRGKLVPQDPNEEPAVELLKRIAAEKARLVKAGEIRRQEFTPDLDHSAFPVTAAVGWALTRLATISRRIHYGYTASADAALKDVRLLRITDIQNNAVDWSSVPGCLIGADEVDQYKLDKGDILIARTGGTIGKTFLVRDVPVTAVFASYLIRIQSTRHVFDEYLKLFLESSLYWTQLREGARGTGQPNVNGQTLGNLVLPLPPLAEQRRIVTKVDELMALCDRLEAARAEREATRDRLTAASLARLNAPDPDTFRDDARFALDALPALTARPDQIRQLRQTILNLAVRGKLVPQDPRDEPASELLSTKTKLPDDYQRRRKILKKTSIEAPEQLFPQLPASWAYIDVQALYDLNAIIDYADGNHGSLYPRSSEFGKSGVTFVTAKDLVDGRVIWDLCVKLSPERASQLTKGWAQGDDVLLTHNATVGRVARVEPGIGRFLLGTSVTFYRLNSEIINPDFFYVVLCSPLWQGQLEAIMAQTTRNQVSIQKQAFFKVVVPPLNEQHRIVRKVDELMALCDRLEASLATADETRRRLLEALLAEALAPDEDRELEAAE